MIVEQQGHSKNPPSERNRTADHGSAAGDGGNAVWHIIVGEYPPDIGGVSDYTFLLAGALAMQGDEVHVWCPESSGEAPPMQRVTVHRELGKVSPADLRRVGKELDRFPDPHRILVQWVPHGFRYRSMNLPFCWWLRNRAARRGDRVDIMLHEPYLEFRVNSIRQSAAAFVHRLMTIVLLRAAERVWMSIPGWEPRWRPYALGRKIPFQWLPIPSGIPVRSDPAGVSAIRRRYLQDHRCLIGHFGTFGWPITSVLEPILLSLCREPDRQTMLFIGVGSQEFRQALIEKDASLERCIQATGPLAAEDISLHLTACDLMIQPYPDGVSTRRTSFMAPLSHGKPIVTTSGPLTEDCWQNGGVVPLAKAGDTAEFVKLVRGLRDDPEERERLARAARELYCERFEVDRIVAALRGSVPLSKGQQAV